MTDFVTSHKQFCLIENGIFIEDGKSGLAMSKRPDFKRMIDTAVEQDVDVIVVQEATRFSRNVGEFCSLRQFLELNRVGILISEGEFWTYYMPPNETPRLASEVAKVEAEVGTTSRRVKNGVNSYRKNGQLVQGSMFGYDLKRAVLRKDNTYTIEPINGATVQKIFDMYVREGIGTEQISTFLNVNNYKTYDGTLNWTASKVLRVLKNEKYMGYIMYGKFKTIHTASKKKIATHIEPIRETIVDNEGNVLQECNLIKGNWEPLVDEETWWKAYEIRKKRSSDFINSKNGALRNGRRNSSDAYANKAFCECGYTLSPQYTHAATDNQPVQFTC